MKQELKKQDLLETVDFYDLMQNYRISPMSNQESVIHAFENVKKFIRDNYTQNKDIENLINK